MKVILSKIFILLILICGILMGGCVIESTIKAEGGFLVPPQEK